MAIGTTAAYDPTTGERRESQFNYTPVDPTEDMMRQAFERSQQTPAPPQPQGPTPYWENPATYYPRQQQQDPVEQSKAATAAAYKYIAFRGYQQDLKEGKSAADAFAKWGPMLVQDTSFGPAMKALTPAPQPAWMPANAATGQPGAFTGRVTVPPQPVAAPQFVPANPQTGEPAHYVQGGKVTQLRAETAPRVDLLTLADYKTAQTEFAKALKVYQDPAESEEMRTEAGVRLKAAKARMENIRGRDSAPKQQAQSPTPSNSKSEKRIHVKDKDGKDWTIPEWQVDIATKQGFTVVK